MSFLRAPFAALATGVLFAGALPPFDQWWLAWLWLLPLLFVLWSPGQRRGACLFFFGFGCGWLAGFSLFLSTLWWAGHVTVPGVLLMCGYLAFYPAVWSGFAVLLRPQTPTRGLLTALTLALLWSGLEWARSVMLTGFPWNSAAVPLVEMPGLRSLASFAGIAGLAALPVFFMSGIAAAWTVRRHRSTRGRAVLMAVSMATPAVVTLATWEHSPQPSATLEVMLVQPNVSMTEKTHLDLTHLSVEERQRRIRDRDITRYAELKFLTLKGLGEAKVKPDLIVWPESAVPWEFYDPNHEEFFDPILKAGSFVLITGCDDRTAAESMDRWELRNCAAMMRGSYDSFQLHAKVHLVPFGEYIPLRRQLPILENMLGHLIPGDFTPGDSLEPLRMEGASWEVIPLICFEDTFGRVAGKFVRDAPQLLVNVTNDNWFHESNESAIHALNARWRCLELRRPMVRASNTGVTCAIDTEGRVIDQLPRWKQGVLHASVSLTPGGITFYAAHGDILAIAAGITALLLAAALLIRRHQWDSTS